MTKENTNKQPVKKYNQGNVKASIWENQSQEGKKFYSVTFTRSYKNTNDQWRNTNSFGLFDLMSLAQVTAKVTAWITFNSKAQKEVA